MEMYWVGMLNSDRNYPPKEHYRLNARIFDALNKNNVDPRVICSLCQLSDNEPDKQYDRGNFEAALLRVLPRDIKYSDRVKVFQLAKVIKSMEFCFWYTFVKLLVCLFVSLIVAALAAWRHRRNRDMCSMRFAITTSTKTRMCIVVFMS